MSTDPSAAVWGLVLTGAVTALLGVFAARVAVNLWKQAKAEMAYLRHPRLIPYNQFSECMDTHEWVEADLALRGLPIDRYRVCKGCGKISGNEEFMVSKEVIEHIREASEIIDKRRASEKEFEDRVNALAEAQVYQYIQREFVSEINYAGNRCEESLVPKLQALVKFAEDAKIEAVEKVLAERAAQVDLDKRYAEWPNKNKGNA